MTARRIRTIQNRPGPPYRLILTLGATGLLVVGILGYAVFQSVQSEAGTRTAPSFTLPALDGGNVSLEQYAGQEHVLLYFNMGTG